MQVVTGEIQLTASDLVGYVNCRYLTHQDLNVAKGLQPKPRSYDPGLEVLVERGRRHEEAYLTHLSVGGRTVTQIEGVGVNEAAVAATLEAMRNGVPGIAQAALRDPPRRTRV